MRDRRRKYSTVQYSSVHYSIQVQQSMVQSHSKTTSKQGMCVRAAKEMTKKSLGEEKEKLGGFSSLKIRLLYIGSTLLPDQA